MATRAGLLRRYFSTSRFSSQITAAANAAANAKTEPVPSTTIFISGNLWFIKSIFVIIRICLFIGSRESNFFFFGSFLGTFWEPSIINEKWHVLLKSELVLKVLKSCPEPTKRYLLIRATSVLQLVVVILLFCSVIIWSLFCLGLSRWM